MAHAVTEVAQRNPILFSFRPNQDRAVKYGLRTSRRKDDILDLRDHQPHDFVNLLLQSPRLLQKTPHTAKFLGRGQAGAKIHYVLRSARSCLGMFGESIGRKQQGAATAQRPHEGFASEITV